MRLFTAIGLPASITERLAIAARRLLAMEASEGSRIHWTRPGNLHITLSFMGQVQPARLEQIERELEAIRAPHLHLELGGIGVFADAGILLVRVKPSAVLLTFAEQVFLAMERCGIPRELHPYTPHVTLARMKGRRGKRTRAQVTSGIRLQFNAGDDPAFWQTFEAAEFCLYESITRPEGPEYRVLRSFPLW